jgi:hypothetical protein
VDLFITQALLHIAAILIFLKHNYPLSFLLSNNFHGSLLHVDKTFYIPFPVNSCRFVSGVIQNHSSSIGQMAFTQFVTSPGLVICLACARMHTLALNMQFRHAALASIP